MISRHGLENFPRSIQNVMLETNKKKNKLDGKKNKI